MQIADFPEILMQRAWTAPIRWMRCHRSIRPLAPGITAIVALNIKNEKGVESADLLFKSYEIRSGKYQLQGLPAVWADENEAQTLEIVLADEKRTG